MSNSNKELHLTVVEASVEDVHKGIARITPACMKELGIEEESIIELTGKRTTYVIAKKAIDTDTVMIM